MATEIEKRTAQAYAAAQARSSVMDIVDMADMVDSSPPVGFLVKGLWPADAYGVFAATDKAGKTWMATDLAVSIATGTPWLGRFETTQGSVVMYSGEGGARNIVRRVRAVTESKGRAFGTLRGCLHVSEVAPRIKDADALEEMKTDFGLFNPSLVIIDPLYLAAIGGKGSDLYAMGEVLVGAQQVCQEFGAALVLTHHWNKTGTGSSANRMTGVGPGAWGRVLGSGDVVTDTAEEPSGKTTVGVDWVFTGSEIPTTKFTATRTVWAEDRNNLTSPMHYEIEVLDGWARDFDKLRREMEELDRLHDWIAANPRQSKNAIERAFGRKVGSLLDTLKSQGRADYVDGPRKAQLWSVS